MNSYYELGSHLTAHADPVSAMHTVTKHYIDEKVTSVDGAKFESGTIPPTKLPVFSGDISNPIGSSVLTLKDSGITGGIYNSFTVDGKGRVLSGTYTPPNTSNLSWSVVINKPTTLGGYGITDVVKSTGDTVATMSMNDTQAVDLNNAITKATLENMLSQVVVASLQTGEVARSSITGTPAGFLRANGAVLSKTTYAGLYGVYGDTYNKPDNGGFGYMGQPWIQQAMFNTASNPSGLTWSAGPALPNGVIGHQSLVTKNRVYLLGGVGNDAVSRVFTAMINPNGTIGTWSLSTSLPADLTRGAFIMTKNRVYMIAGLNAWVNSKLIYTAPINEDGTLGTWVQDTSFPINCYGHRAFVTKNRVYVLGGDSGVMFSSSNFHRTIYTAPINADGTIGAWTTAGNILYAFSEGQLLVTSSRVYLLGGSNTSDGTANSLVQSAPINADGTLGTWVAGTSLPVSLRAQSIVATKSRAWMFGGFNNSSYIATVYSTPINADGTIGGWSVSTALPIAIGFNQTFITSSRLYVTGGMTTGSNATTGVQMSNFAGGVDDYQALVATNSYDPSTFALPDYTSKETDNLFYYIKL